MASCGTPGSGSSHPASVYTPSPLPQVTNPAGYEVRPKMEVVKPKIRGTTATEARVVGNDGSKGASPGGQLPPSEMEGQTYIIHETQGEVLQKRSFDQAFSGSSASSGDNTPGVNMQLGPSDGFSNVQVNAPPATSLPANAGMMKSGANYGMEYWNGPMVVGQEAARPHSMPSTFLHPTASMSYHGPSSDGGSTGYWIQDEKELKRQKRKEANRESARRSRMRKQAECDELSEKVQALTAENESLRVEVERLSELCQKLSSENLVLLERLKK